MNCTSISIPNSYYMNTVVCNSLTQPQSELIDSILLKVFETVIEPYRMSLLNNIGSNTDKLSNLPTILI